MGAAAAGKAAAAVAAASPAAAMAMAGGTSWLGNMMVADGSTAMAPAYYWWQDQMGLTSWDYYEKTGGKDFSKAP